MHRILFPLAVLGIAACSPSQTPAAVSTPTPTAATAPSAPHAPVDTAAVATATGGKPEAADGVVKVSFPRTDVSVEIDRWQMPPFMGLTSWAGFVPGEKPGVDAMVMGDPLDEATDIGTIISQDQFDKVSGFIREGMATPGAVGRPASAMPADPAMKDGLFIRPHIFSGLPDDSRLVQEEIFGPVTCVFPFDDAESVLAQANGTEFGLAASVWTNNLRIGLDLAHRLEAGLVQINQNLVVQANLSYGGVKSSGLGKEASLESMLEHFMHKKTIMVNYG